jgi:hypothetical protein
MTIEVIPPSPHPLPCLLLIVSPHASCACISRCVLQTQLQTAAFLLAAGMARFRGAPQG